MKINGTTGDFIEIFVSSTPELGEAIDILLGPTGDFYVSASSETNGSHVRNIEITTIPLLFLFCFFYPLIY